MAYSSDEQSRLLQVALASINSGIRSGKPETINSQAYPRSLNETRASFVTLKKDAMLRGCIGSLEAHRCLVEDVAANAFAAAFLDPRFHKLEREELDSLDIGISVLGPSEALSFDSEQSLLEMLRPGEDGLILHDGNARATFLPAVWESLPEAADFLGQLKVKAGLTADYWSDTLVIRRYSTESFSAPVTEIRKRKEGSFSAE
jgi:hypothetical protein